MSNVSNVHSLVKFESGKSVPFSGQRLAKVGYKDSKKGKAKFESVCASIPMIDREHVEENQLRLMDWIVENLEGIQDKIIRGLHEAGKTEVLDSDISVDACIAYIDAESNGGRMTKETIEKWFSDYLEENLTMAVAEKMGVTEEDICTENEKSKKLEQMINSYKGSLSALSGGATVYPVDKVKQLIRALEFSASEDNTGIADKLTKRLNGMIEPKKEEALLAL